ncbi:hypothetical protein OPV22_003485 [Ensete ventricosum]|uniref:Uncharacterized protein n=1 Tax=Ensete ventricosum TaxID=4639 RepID=A0AAV8S122_ENSVE|nr:hypothetical protein OPV22_003485 [Ensete ventricosum]
MGIRSNTRECCRYTTKPSSMGEEDASVDVGFLKVSCSPHRVVVDRELRSRGLSSSSQNAVVLRFTVPDVLVLSTQSRKVSIGGIADPETSEVSVDEIDLGLDQKFGGLRAFLLQTPPFFEVSSSHYYPPCPPKSQRGDAESVSSSPAPASTILEEKPSEEKIAAEQNSAEDGKDEILLKSSLKKPRASDLEPVGKGNVKWLDLLGKELVEIKEFEAIESEESEDYADDSTACICVIQ